MDLSTPPPYRLDIQIELAAGAGCRSSAPVPSEGSGKVAARGYHRVLRVARTFANLDGAERVGQLHIVKALSYRQKLAAFRPAA